MTMQEFLTRVFTTAAKLHTTGNVLLHSYEVSNLMALSSYRHGTRKAVTPVDTYYTGETRVEVAKRLRRQPAPEELSQGTSPPSLGQERLLRRSTNSAASRPRRSRVV
jgi:hypothetical protein